MLEADIFSPSVVVAMAARRHLESHRGSNAIPVVALAISPGIALHHKIPRRVIEEASMEGSGAGPEELPKRKQFM